jgi:hypothetical protein
MKEELIEKLMKIDQKIEWLINHQYWTWAELERDYQRDLLNQLNKLY